MREIIYRKFIPVSVTNEYADGPSLALVELSARYVKRILKLANAAKTLDVAGIKDFDSPTEFFGSCDFEFPSINPITNDTPLKKCGLHINDDNPIIALYAKRRLAGKLIDDEEAYEEIKTLLTSWDGAIDCERIHIEKDCFYYQGYLKHSDVSWSTDSIMVDSLPGKK